MSTRHLQRDSRRTATEPAAVAAPPAPFAGAAPCGRVLGNGRYRALLTTAGTGGAWLDDQALTAWRGDRVEDGDGWFLYLRDRDDGSFWSLAHQPVPATPEHYAVEDEAGAVGFLRRERGIESRMAVWVDCDSPAECRRVRLLNTSDRRRRLELTSYLEVVLQPARSHWAHPAFSKLFVQTEAVAGRPMLLAWRRPRAPGDQHPWLAQTLVGPGEPSHETDRARFLGRGRGPDAPFALVSPEPFSGRTGDVLDPVFAMRRIFELGPGEAADFDLVLAAGPDRERALEVADRLAAPGGLAASRARSLESARERAQRHGWMAAEAERLERLAAAMLYSDPTLRPAPPEEHESVAGPGPVVLLGPDTSPDLVSSALAAQAYWRDLGLPSTVVVAADAGWRARADLIVEGELPALEHRLPPRGAAVATGAARGPSDPGAIGGEALRCFNGFGGFSPRGDEYVIRMDRTALGAPLLPPRPWINVLANPEFGTIVSESGAGYTWSRNSREFRLTPWANDPVRDPHHEALYVRDEESGRFWSPFPGPAPGEGPYEMRHGFGYSRCLHRSGGLELDTEVFVHADHPVKVVRVKIRNAGDRPRRLSLVSYQRLVLGELPEAGDRGVTTWCDDDNQILMARRAAAGPFADAVAFAAPVAGEGWLSARLGTDRARFMGPGGTPARPAALLAGAGPAGREAAADPCFWIEVPLDLDPGVSRWCAFLLGEHPNTAAILGHVQRLRQPGAIDRALEDVRGRWKERVGRVQIETPLESLDLLVNGWLAYQTLACRLWARTALYQSGGAFGFRDQLQDAASFAALEPRITREQIVRHAAHQFVEGDVLHWWHPPEGRGIRTRFADDLLWLPLVTAGYVRTTGDESVLDERAPFLEARRLAPGEDEAFLAPEVSGEVGDVYEHCWRAIDRSLVGGPHGLPLFGGGDWNDGMNRVGRQGKGESVWMAFFLHAVLDGMAPLCERRGDAGRAARYRAYQEKLRHSVESAGWDGEWYRRGYYDDGAPLGSRESDECQIDALVQAWAVLSQVAPRERAEQAMDAVEQRLVSWGDGLVRLLTPPFDRTGHDPGYIKGYVPGVRENGGQYTHAALWVAAAEAHLGRREHVARLLDGLSPVTRTRDERRARLYQAEPYAIAGDVSTNPGNVGRAGWSWYTGSSGWMLRVVLESLLGVTVQDGAILVVRPGIPESWPGFRAVLRPLGGRETFEIVVRKPNLGAGQVVRVRMDDRNLEPVAGAAHLPILGDGLNHRVEVDLG
jgi:cyclic beta-1,2-glucan synthetase